MRETAGTRARRAGRGGDYPVRRDAPFGALQRDTMLFVYTLCLRVLLIEGEGEARLFRAVSALRRIDLRTGRRGGVSLPVLSTMGALRALRASECACSSA